MTPTTDMLAYLCKTAAECLAAGSRVSLAIPVERRWPKGFPRGEVMCVNLRTETRSFDPLKVLAWAQRAAVEAKAGADR